MDRTGVHDPQRMAKLASACFASAISGALRSCRSVAVAASVQSLAVAVAHHTTNEKALRAPPSSKLSSWCSSVGGNSKRACHRMETW
jgi:hypothetical protein